MTLVVALVLAVALFFHLVAALGVTRLPDFYTRLHAVSKAETVGSLFVILALVLHAGPTLLAGKLVFVAMFLFLANPTSTHAIARAAYRSGLRPWLRAEPASGTGEPS